MGNNGVISIEDGQGGIKSKWQDSDINKFISRATDKCLPFFHTLKKSFEWTDEGQ